MGEEYPSPIRLRLRGLGSIVSSQRGSGAQHPAGNNQFVIDCRTQLVKGKFSLTQINLQSVIFLLTVSGSGTKLKHFREVEVEVKKKLGTISE